MRWRSACSPHSEEVLAVSTCASSTFLVDAAARRGGGRKQGKEVKRAILLRTMQGLRSALALTCSDANETTIFLPRKSLSERAARARLASWARRVRCGSATRRQSLTALCQSSMRGGRTWLVSYSTKA